MEFLREMRALLQVSKGMITSFIIL